MAIAERNWIVILILGLMISAGLVFPLLAVSIVGHSSHRTEPRGVPVSDSAFADLVYTEPDPIARPQNEIVETESSITMDCWYDSLVTVNETQAVSTALEFISDIWYLSAISFSLDTGWTRLDDTEWIFRFRAETVDAYIGVDAISGKISHFTSRWTTEESPFNTTAEESNVATTDQLEDRTLDFLARFNYSLSPYAWYVGPNLSYNHGLHQDVFQLSFYNFVNGVLVQGGNVVRLVLDLEARAVLKFRYEWIHIDSIPTERIIPTARAEEIAVEYLRNRSLIAPTGIISTTLAFQITSVGPVGSMHTQYRLSWIVCVDIDAVSSVNLDVMAVLVDAKSGTLYDSTHYVAQNQGFPDNPVSLAASRPPATIVWWMLAASVVVATVISLAARKRLKPYF
ncbi:MAG: hypothetical protein ACOC38_08810 [Promethearchaeia archaeon]